MPHTLDGLLEYARQYVAENLPGESARLLRLDLASGSQVRHPVSPCRAGAPAEERPFEPSAFQQAILDALDGKALRTDDLGAAVKDRSRLFKAHGLPELRERGLIDHSKRCGYFRPDAPPEELASE
jgi:hypothetical protein